MRSPVSFGPNKIAKAVVHARSGLRPWLRSASPFCLAVPLLVAAASYGRAADMNLTNDPTHRWGENKIVVNPKNPNNLILATVGTGFTKDCQAHSADCKMVGADFGIGRPFPQAQGIFTNPNFNVIAAYISMDAGKTWKQVRIPVTPVDHPDLTGPGDPNVTATPDGTLYFSFDDNNWGTPEHALPDGGIGVSKSSDGGLTWSKPVLAGTPVDGPKITSDSITGKIYEASSTMLGPHSTGDVNSPRGKVMDRWLVSSEDGVHWTPPQPMGGMGGSIDAAYGILATAFIASPKPSMFSAPNGQYCGTAPTPCVVFETTKDAGVSWSRHVLPVQFSGEMGPGSAPMVAADPSKKGHFTVAVAMNGKEYDVFQTRDFGTTWSGPTVVTDDASKIHYHSWMAYSPKGVLGIMWQTSQPEAGQTATGAPGGGPGGGPAFPYNVWAAVSRDGGATFSEPLEASSANSPAPQSGMFANAGDDYSSIAVSGDHVYVTWADWRSPERDNYFNDIKLEDFKFKH